MPRGKVELSVCSGQDSACGATKSGAPSVDELQHVEADVQRLAAPCSSSLLPSKLSGAVCPPSSTGTAGDANACTMPLHAKAPATQLHWCVV